MYSVVEKISWSVLFEERVIVTKTTHVTMIGYIRVLRTTQILLTQS